MRKDTSTLKDAYKGKNASADCQTDGDLARPNSRTNAHQNSYYCPQYKKGCQSYLVQFLPNEDDVAISQYAAIIGARDPGRW